MLGEDTKAQTKALGARIGQQAHWKGMGCDSKLGSQQTWKAQRHQVSLEVPPGAPLPHGHPGCWSKVGGSADPTTQAIGNGHESMGQRGPRGLQEGAESSHQGTTAPEIQWTKKR